MDEQVVFGARAENPIAGRDAQAEAEGYVKVLRQAVIAGGAGGAVAPARLVIEQAVAEAEIGRRHQGAAQRQIAAEQRAQIAGVVPDAVDAPGAARAVIEIADAGDDIAGDEPAIEGVRVAAVDADIGSGLRDEIRLAIGVVISFRTELETGRGLRARRRSASAKAQVSTRLYSGLSFTALPDLASSYPCVSGQCADNLLDDPPRGRARRGEDGPVGNTRVIARPIEKPGDAASLGGDQHARRVVPRQ